MALTQTAEPTAARGAPPGPPLYSMPGTLMDIWRDRLGLMTRVSNRYGDVVRFKMGPKSLYFFNHPDHAKHVLAEHAANYHKGLGLIQAKRVLGEGLLTSEGDLWRAQRKTIQPTFARDRIAGFAGVVAGEAENLLARLRATPPGQSVDMVQEMTRLTVRVLGSTLLDADISGRHGLAESFETAQDQAMFEMVTLGMVPQRLPIPRNRRFQEARRNLERIVFELVAEREADGRLGDDMVSRLLIAYRDEPDHRLRRRRLRDEMITMLLAGHETTASTLSWTWYLVDQHPEVAERMHAEAVAVLGDRPPQYADLHELRYTRSVIQEAMRLYPPVWILPRRAVEEDTIDGWRVKKGTDVMICPYTLHRHPDFWPDPLRFDPDRFSPERERVRHRYAYLPFGAGPRFCVGQNLGLMEAVFVAATVARDVRLRLAAGYRVVGDPMLSLRVRGGLPMTVHAAAAGGG